MDTLVGNIATGYRVLSSGMYFKACTVNYSDLPSNISDQNKVRLDQLAAKVEKFPGYKFTLVGYAVMVNPKL